MQLAQFISVLGHPLFMPSYSFGILIYFNPYINMMLTETSKKYILSVLVAFTIILPMLTVMVFKLFGLIDSVFMKTSKERILPFLVTLIWYYLGFQLLTKIYIPQIFLLIIIGAICNLGIALIITSRWKISVHMLGIGGVIGGILGVSQRIQFDHSLLLAALILFSGFVGYARLKTNSHNYPQVYTGFIIGAIIEWVCVIYF